MDDLKFGSSSMLVSLIDRRLAWCLEALQQLPGERAVSLTATKAEEAQMWLEKVSTSTRDRVRIPD